MRAEKISQTREQALEAGLEEAEAESATLRTRVVALEAALRNISIGNYEEPTAGGYARAALAGGEGGR